MQQKENLPQVRRWPQMIAVTKARPTQGLDGGGTTDQVLFEEGIPSLQGHQRTWKSLSWATFGPIPGGEHFILRCLCRVVHAGLGLAGDGRWTVSWRASPAYLPSLAIASLGIAPPAMPRGTSASRMPFQVVQGQAGTGQAQWRRHTVILDNHSPLRAVSHHGFLLVCGRN